MSRAYVVVKAGKVARIERAVQGRLTTFLDGNDGRGRAILPASTVAGLADGVYRLALGWIDLGRYRGAWNVGKLTKVEPAKEAARLRALEGKTRSRARTRSPGIEGFMQRELAAQSAQEARWQETYLLRGMLEDLQTEIEKAGGA